MTAEELRAAVDELPWFHTIDLGDGVITPGHPPNEALERPGAFPDVSGRTVLDIGTWDGKYAFRAEREGARRVVAIDHYAWCVDFDARNRYWEECRAAGTLPDPDRDERDFWQEETAPGRRSFDVAWKALNSQVEPILADFMRIDLSELGTFDVVLYFGVLYHLQDPLAALRRVRLVTSEVAVIETAAVWIPKRDANSLVWFIADNELTGDYGNWYVPSLKALHDMCLAAGFRRVETRVGPPPPDHRARRLAGWYLGRPGRIEQYRAVVHAYP